MNVCPICDSVKIRKLLKWKKYTIQTCTSCKVLFSTPLPSNKELLEYYQGFMFNKPEDYEIEKQVNARKQEISKLFDFSTEVAELSKRTFLDHGGGTGAVFKATSELGIDSYYYDLDEDAKSFSKSKFGLSDDKIIEDTSKCTIKFDYVLSDNVIEHVKNPQLFLDELISLLKPGGKLVIKTPHARNTELLLNPNISIKQYLRNALSYNSFLSSIRGYFLRFWSCDPPRHIYSFSKESLNILSSKAKHKSSITSEIRYYEVPWFRNTITKSFFSKDKRLSPVASILVRLLIFPIVPLEVFLQLISKVLLKIGILTPGGIILCIAKKP